MIQLSDTKAASYPGALLGQKPMAGGDASAFALALGSMVPDGAPGFAFTLPRQPIAAPGSELPEAESDAETEAAIGAEIGILLSAIPVASEAKPQPATKEESEPLARPSVPAYPGIKGEQPETEKTAPAGIDGAPPVSGESTGTVDAPARAPQTGSDVERPTALAPLASPPGEARQSATGSDTPDAVPAVPVSLQNAAPSASALPAPTAKPVTQNPAVTDAAPVDRTALATRLKTTTALAAPAQSDATPAPAKPRANAEATTSAPIAATPTPKPVTQNPTATDAAPTDRPALATRLKTTMAVAAPARIDATPAPAKPRANAEATTSTAVAAAPAPKPEAIMPTPAKFVPAERTPDAPTERAAPRRITLPPVIPATTTSAAIPMTVADLIPAQHRQRAGIVPLAPVLDPANAGLSTPIEAASRIAEPAPIDTNAADWIEGMIEQIEVMRDARADGATATTTRIRLAPDALGAIDIMLVGEGEAIDVRIHADNAAARTLLAEAAPRLADMAEARGLKLAQSDAGHPGERQAQRQQSHEEPAANRRRTGDSAATGGDADERIA